MSCIFLSGIHGAGKTTLVNKINKVHAIPHFTVSNLIRNAGNNIKSIEKRTYDIAGNQILWKKELNSLLGKYPILLLDGHFSLLDSKNNIVKLPFTTFDNIDINKIILVERSPECILQSLTKRDHTAWNIILIKKFLGIERSQAEAYAEIMGIQLFIYNNDNLFSSLIEFIKN